MNYRLHTYEDPELTARALAELITEKAKTKAMNSEKLNIAVSGGKTPSILFTLMAQEFYNVIPWNSVRFFWVDERCVEPTDPESNFGMTYDAFFRFAYINPANLFRMKGEDVPDDEVERYQKLLWDELPVKNKFPVFDLILLGIGDDGHTASIFPDNLALLRSDFSVAVAKHPFSGQKRITLTGKTLCNAHQVVFFITGLNKSEIVHQIINKKPEAKKYPASYIHDNEGNIDFYLDNQAAAKL
ncbi:MAG TPA: 6-phosphogluconolactonase [Paludibacter sp.]|nr:6-phosphogluconolactonase [Paludibacter sp.]